MQDICPFCNKLIINLDEVKVHPQTKELYHDCCLSEAQPIRPSTGKLQSGSQKFHNRADRRGKESLAAAQDALAGAPSPGEWGPQKP